jgi:hypothetical protein
MIGSPRQVRVHGHRAGRPGVFEAIPLAADRVLLQVVRIDLEAVRPIMAPRIAGFDRGLVEGISGVIQRCVVEVT